MHSVKRSTTALTAILLLLGLIGAGAPAGAATNGPVDYRKVTGLSEPTYETTRDVVKVKAFDGVDLYVEVTRPKAEGHFPVILEASPYHGTLHTREGTRIFPDPRDASGNQLGLTGYFAPRGYAVVMMDLRGTGRSQGCLDHLGQKDARDLKAIVEWAATQPWSSGRVGMTGHSYVGSTPSVAAAQNPEGLVTIVPSAGLASMYDHQFHMGVPWYLQWAGPQWAYPVLSTERHLPSGVNAYSKGGDNFGNDMTDFGCGWQNSAFTAGTGQLDGQYQGWHAQRDWRPGAAAADIPIFMVHGVNDNAARIPAAEWFFKGRTPRPDDKVWLGQWDHGGSGGRCRAAHPNCRFSQWQYALHAWFDKHLQQRDVETGPSVEVFLNDLLVHAADRWDAKATPLTLFADGAAQTLQAQAPSTTAQRSFVGSAQLTASSYVQFTSAPLKEDLLVAGMPQLHLSASTTGPVQLVASLYKQHAGRIDFNNPLTVCAIQPSLRYSTAAPAPVVPGERMELAPQCFTSGHWVEQGHELVLRVTTANRGTGSHHAPTMTGDPQVTVYTGAGGTAITLPQVSSYTLYKDVGV